MKKEKDKRRVTGVDFDSIRLRLVFLDGSERTIPLMSVILADDHGLRRAFGISKQTFNKYIITGTMACPGDSYVHERGRVSFQRIMQYLHYVMVGQGAFIITEPHEAPVISSEVWVEYEVIPASAVKSACLMVKEE